MPAANTPWPPNAWAPAYAQYAENDAWLTGDTKALAGLYGGQGGATHTRAGVAHRGGLVGAASRLMWGRPIPAGEQRTRVHLPIPADLATLASDLQYSDPPVTSIADGGNKVDEKTTARLDLILNSDSHHAMLNSMGEIKSALGATVVLPRWDKDLEDHMWLDYAAADTVIPVFRHGRLVEVSLWTDWLDGHVHYRHIEHHQVGSIEHALYQGTTTNFGRRVDLAAHPSTEYLVTLVDGTSRIATGIDRLTAAYLPNAPALAWRNQAELKDAGRSDFNQLPPLFDNADEAWSSWMRGLKIGSAKLIVPESYLRSNGPGAGASFDALQEMFVGLNIPGRADGLQLSAHQFKIRTREHKDTLDEITGQILQKAGFSPSAWGLGEKTGSQATATEIKHREQRAETTRSKKNLYDRRVLSRMGSVALELDGILFPGRAAAGMSSMWSSRRSPALTRRSRQKP